MLKVSRILTATPPPLEVHKEAVYYHGIRHADEALARGILTEGLKNLPSDFWGDKLKPQDAVYMTKHLGTAMAYCNGEAQVENFPDFIHEMVYENRGHMYIAEIDGKNLKADIEVDEDELNELLNINRDIDLDELDPDSPKTELLTLWSNFNQCPAKELIPHLPEEISYWLLQHPRFQNLAHQGPIPVSKIWVWDLTDADAELCLRESYTRNVPVGAEMLS